MGGDRVAAFRQESFVVAPSPLVARIFCFLSFLPGKRKKRKFQAEKKLKCQIETFGIRISGYFWGKESVFFSIPLLFGVKEKEICVATLALRRKLSPSPLLKKDSALLFLLFLDSI